MAHVINTYTYESTKAREALGNAQPAPHIHNCRVRVPPLPGDTDNEKSTLQIAALMRSHAYDAGKTTLAYWTDWAND